MKIAHAAGISVFATGGIGGVHRGADQSELFHVFGVFFLTREVLGKLLNLDNFFYHLFKFFFFRTAKKFSSIRCFG